MSESLDICIDDTAEIILRERREWSKLVSFICYIGIAVCVLATILLICFIAIPGIVGFSHVNFIVGVLLAFLACAFLLLYKARNDSRSLIFLSIFAISVGSLIIGVCGGVLIHKT